MPERTCSAPGCDRPRKTRQFCAAHYVRVLRGNPDTGPIRRLGRGNFWMWVDRSGGLDACWPWTGAKDALGYGRISRPTYGQSLAHRYVWSLVAGVDELPEAVMHECDNPPCCNPLHLTPGTRLLNNQQAWERGLHPRGERHGTSRLTETDVLEIRRRVAMGELQRPLAVEYGIDPSHVSRIVNRHVWRHI